MSFPHVYEYHFQCVFTFVASIFLQRLLELSHGPNHCFTSSSPPSIPRCPIAASSTRIFSFNFQNRICTETLLHCKVHEFSFPTSPHSPKIDSEQESYVYFIPALQYVPNFRTRSVQIFLPYLLVRVFKFIDPGCVGTGILWSF